MVTSKFDYFGGTGEYALADKRRIEEALTTYGSSDSLFNKDKYYAPMIRNFTKQALIINLVNGTGRSQIQKSIQYQK